MLQLPPRLRASVLTLLSVGLLFAAATLPAIAQSTDFTAFRAACANGAGFLIGETPNDPQPVMDVLCPCLETGFSNYSQAEVDALEADLRTGDSAEAKARYTAYAELQDKASTVLGNCFASADVVEATKGLGL
jgi:hypothetical protein